MNLPECGAENFDLLHVRPSFLDRTLVHCSFFCSGFVPYSAMNLSVSAINFSTDVGHGFANPAPLPWFGGLHQAILSPPAQVPQFRTAVPLRRRRTHVHAPVPSFGQSVVRLSVPIPDGSGMGLLKEARSHGFEVKAINSRVDADGSSERNSGYGLLSRS